MNRDPRMAGASRAIVKLANECAQGTVTPLAVGHEIAFGLAEFVTSHFSPGAAAALLRQYAAQVDGPDRQAIEPSARELLDLTDQAQQYINSLQIAGIDESAAVSCLVNACIFRAARARGAKGAADWLRKLADHTENHAGAINVVALAS